ncbi:MAG: hypothetical protein ACI8P3_001162 [Saprospiraceae bacterium]
MKKGIFTLLFASLFFLAQAQMGWEAGGWIGSSFYFGDLNTEFNLKPALAGGLVGRYNFNERICLKFSANYGSISADDANSQNTYQQTRNLHFRSTVFDGATQMEFNFLPYVHGSKDKFYTPYLFAGFSVFHFEPQAKYQGDWVDLRPLGTEGQFKGEEYSTLQGALVYGFGLKLDLSYEWSLNFELSSRRLFTDYLDDVSTVYPDLDDLGSLHGQIAVDLSDPSFPSPEGIKIGQVGRQRGNSNSNDIFVFVGIGLVYYFGDIRCPPYSR